MLLLFTIYKKTTTKQNVDTVVDTAVYFCSISLKYFSQFTVSFRVTATVNINLEVLAGY